MKNHQLFLGLAFVPIFFLVACSTGIGAAEVQTIVDARLKKARGVACGPRSCKVDRDQRSGVWSERGMSDWQRAGTGSSYGCGPGMGKPGAGEAWMGKRGMGKPGAGKAWMGKRGMGKPGAGKDDFGPRPGRGN